MVHQEAIKELRKYLRGAALPNRDMTIEEGVEAMIRFYREVHATDCDLERDGDMLLVQWGVYDWGKGEHFEFDLTRQFIPVKDEEPEMWQLSLKYQFTPDDELRSIGEGNKWWSLPAKVAEFREYVKGLPVYMRVRTRTSPKCEISFSLV